jgi:hypothetical protein
LYSEDKGRSRSKEDKETNMEKVKRENKRRNKREK